MVASEHLRKGQVVFREDPYANITVFDPSTKKPDPNIVRLLKYCNDRPALLMVLHLLNSQMAKDVFQRNWPRQRQTILFPEEDEELLQSWARKYSYTNKKVKALFSIVATNLVTIKMVINVNDQVVTIDGGYQLYFMSNFVKESSTPNVTIKVDGEGTRTLVTNQIIKKVTALHAGSPEFV